MDSVYTALKTITPALSQQDPNSTYDTDNAISEESSQEEDILDEEFTDGDKQDHQDELNETSTEPILEFDIKNIPENLLDLEEPLLNVMEIAKPEAFMPSKKPGHFRTTQHHFQKCILYWRRLNNKHTELDIPFCRGHTKIPHFLACMSSFENRYQCPHFPENFKELSDSEVLNMLHDRLEDPSNKASPHSKYK